jgi:protein-disulfide isomerase/uncharacterized membrane protein
MEKLLKNNLVILIFALLGVITSLKLCLIYYHANFIGGDPSSFCVINETLDCDAVARTEFSHFLGVPLSLWGLLFYISVIFLAKVDFLKKIKHLNFLEIFKHPKSYIFCISVFATAISVLLAMLSHFQIHKICILCYFTYILNLLILIASKNGESVKTHFLNSVKDFFETFKKPVLGSLFILIAVIFVSVLYYTGSSGVFISKKSYDIANILSENSNSLKGNFLGDKNAKVIFHEYTDFQCPYCETSNSYLIRLVNEVDNVMVIHHNLPLDSACNSLVQGKGHVNSCLYAQYSLAAKNQDRGAEFNTELFKNNESLTEQKVLEIAKNLNIDIEKLKTDSYLPETKQELKKEIDAAINMGITGTPTYRIGLKLHQGLLPYKNLKEIALDAGGKQKK